MVADGRRADVAKSRMSAANRSTFLVEEAFAAATPAWNRGPCEVEADEACVRRIGRRSDEVLAVRPPISRTRAVDGAAGQGRSTGPGSRWPTDGGPTSPRCRMGRRRTRSARPRAEAISSRLRKRHLYRGGSAIEGSLYARASTGDGRGDRNLGERGGGHELLDPLGLHGRHGGRTDGGSTGGRSGDTEDGGRGADPTADAAPPGAPARRS